MSYATVTILRQIRCKIARSSLRRKRSSVIGIRDVRLTRCALPNSSSMCCIRWLFISVYIIYICACDMKLYYLNYWLIPKKKNYKKKESINIIGASRLFLFLIVINFLLSFLYYLIILLLLLLYHQVQSRNKSTR